MGANKVSHICIIDNEANIYLENNERLGGLSFVGGKLEEDEQDDFEKGALRELYQETGGFFSFPKGILEEIETNADNINNIIWEGTLYGLKISTKVGELLTNDNKNIIQVKISDINQADFSQKIDREKIIQRIKLTIKKFL